MLIRIGYDIAFESPAPVPMVLMLFVRPELTGRMLRQDALRTEPSIPIEPFLDGYGNQCARIVAPAGRLRLVNDALIEDSGEPEAPSPEAEQHEISALPVETLPYLLASRYCEVDRLSNLAWDLFGRAQPGWARVQAVCDWVHGNVRFGYEYARPTKTAHDVYDERTAVCRDFTHLSVTFCRALNIPARYVTGYLGDIGVPPQVAPMDFSAWFEVFLGGRWHTFDARHNRPRIGRILMAKGRDAVDVALTTSFGPNTLVKFDVVTQEVASA